MRFAALPVLCILIPACGGQQPNAPLNLPGSLPDATYANGHPLVFNAPYNAAILALENGHHAAVNAWRVSAGLPAFGRCDSLDAIARAYSRHMAAHPFFGHIAPEGGDLGARVYAASGVVMVYSTENLMAATDGSALAVLSAFLASPSHKAAISTTAGNTLGVGIWHDGAKYLITYEFVWR